MDVSDERDALAKRCQSYSPIVSPWAVKSRLPSRSISTDFYQSDKVFSFKSPASFCSSSSAGSTIADDAELDSPFDDSGSHFMKEFQEAAAQLAELAKSAKFDEDEESDRLCLEKLDCNSLGWVAVTKEELREDAKKVLVNSLDKVTGEGSITGKSVRLGLFENDLKISVEGLTCLSINRKNLKVWSVISGKIQFFSDSKILLQDHLCIVYKNGRSYECQVFTDEGPARLLDFW